VGLLIRTEILLVSELVVILVVVLVVVVLLVAEVVSVVHENRLFRDICPSCNLRFL
jgi:hypothetical protein